MQVNNNNNDNFEQHPDVIHFLESNNPTVEIMARAYYARDVAMNLGFNNIVAKAFNKLNYTPGGINRVIRNGFMRYIDGLMRQFLQNPDIDPFGGVGIPQLYEEYVENNRNEIEYRVERYNFLMNFINTNDHFEFYKNMTNDELVYIGW
jgi:hypothetical protein